MLPAVLFSGKVSGEAPTGDPYSRVPRLAQPQIKRIAESIAHGNSPENPMSPGEFVLLMDGRASITDSAKVSDLTPFSLCRQWGGLVWAQGGSHFYTIRCNIQKATGF